MDRHRAGVKPSPRRPVLGTRSERLSATGGRHYWRVSLGTAARISAPARGTGLDVR